METPTNTPPRLAWDWAGWWTLVFVCNLPVPVFLGAFFAVPDGWFGLVGALVVVFWVGLIPCLFRFPTGRSLTWGGVIVAATQLFPILHVGCGVYGLRVWDWIGGQPLLRDEDFNGPVPGWQGDQNFGTFLVVFFTAHPLLVIAILLGEAARWIKGDHPIWFARRTDPDAEGGSGSGGEKDSPDSP